MLTIFAYKIGMTRHSCVSHRYVFEVLGKEFFRSLGTLVEYDRNKKIAQAENYNVGKAPAKQRRVPYWREPARKSDESDTVSTSDVPRSARFFERSMKITPHAVMHFTDQVLIAGTHAFNDTAANEASHPCNLKQANQRCRKYHESLATTLSMLNYMCDTRMLKKVVQVSGVLPPGLSCCHSILAICLVYIYNCLLITSCLHVLHTVATDKSGLRTRQRDSTLTSVRLTHVISGPERALAVLARGSRGMAVPLHPSTLDTVICAGVPLSLRELVTAVVDNLGLQVNMHNCLRVLECSWNLGWHVMCSTSCGTTRHFRGGGAVHGSTSAYLRGDWVETRITDESVDRVKTSRLCRIICGVQLKNLRKVTRLDFPVNSGDDDTLAWETIENKKHDTMNFLLVRYAKPHPHVRRRGPKHRPLCPGILQHTHCLWTWATRDPTFRRGCFVGRAWDRNKHFFGDTLESQNHRKTSEQHAWYDLIQVSDIVAHTNVQLDPDRDGAFLQSVMWC